MRKIVLIAAVAGFLIAASWMLLGFVLFNLPNGATADAYYNAGRLVCPIFPVTGRYSAYGPFANAVLCASIAWIIMRLKRRKAYS